jgi:hypothetical protein
MLSFSRILIFQILFIEKMGVDLVPEVRKFSIVEGKFVSMEHSDPTNQREIQDYSVEDRCISEGWHKVLRFDILTRNKGDKSLVIGEPKEPLFEHNPNPKSPHKLIMKEKFMKFKLTNKTGVKYDGFKKPFCIKGGFDTSTGMPFSCGYQGIGPGSFDPYLAYNACQFIIIDDIVDGEYSFEATINPPLAHGRRLFQEDKFDNNTIKLLLVIKKAKVRKKGKPK